MRMQVRQAGGVDLDHEFKRLDSGAQLWAPFRAVFDDDELRVTLDIDVVDGRPSCRGYHVELLDGSGLEFLTTEMMRGFNLRALMSHAVAVAVGTFIPDPSDRRRAIDGAVGSLRRRRRPVTDERLTEFADFYRLHFRPGGMGDLAGEFGVGERQAWRLKRLAVQRGFLEEE
jgi:hypothetical protein